MTPAADAIRPLILGRGAAGQALRHALAAYPDDTQAAVWLERDSPLPAPRDPRRDLLVLANPHALHAPRLLEAAELGYRYCISEKPVAVSLAQVDSLAGLPLEVWVCHGYRTLWGPQELARARREGRFGRVVSIEGRYWQSSATRGPEAPGWKDDVALSGEFDVLLDLATHWADLVCHLAGRTPDAMEVRRWYVNAASPHRDTHVHLGMDFGDFASFGSISKAVHGAGNLLELHVIGEKAAATWRFSDPDTLEWGEGPSRRTEVRREADRPARPGPFHGLGWMEGYLQVTGAALDAMRGRPTAPAPTLAEHLAVVRCLLTAAAREA